MMEMTSENNWRELTMEVHCFKEDNVSHIDTQYWEEKMEEYISPIFTNIIIWLLGMEGGIPPEGNFNGGKTCCRP